MAGVRSALHFDAASSLLYFPDGACSIKARPKNIGHYASDESAKPIQCSASAVSGQLSPQRAQSDHHQPSSKHNGTPPPHTPTLHHQLTSLLNRTLSTLTTLPTRPLPPPHPTSLSAFASDKPTSSLRLLSQPQLSLQVRTAIRDTYNPSHRVRKRRHGFLSRLKTRTGRKLLKRRRVKGRSTLSH